MNWLPQFVRQHRDVLLVGPPGVGKSHLVQAIGLEALKAGFVVLYRSIFDLVRELLSQETLAAEARLLNKYLKPDLLIIDDMGLKILPPKSGEVLLEIIMRRYENRSTRGKGNGPVPLISPIKPRIRAGRATGRKRWLQFCHFLPKTRVFHSYSKF